MDLIDRAELPTLRIEINKRIDDETCRLLETLALHVHDVIQSAPAVDAEPVRHGYWIEAPYLLGMTRYCSRCRENYGMPHGVFNYCPNCGTKMDGAP